MEERNEVKTIQVDYKCPKCETGYLRPTGLVLSPKIYPHKCNVCKYTKRFEGNVYPFIVYEPINKL